MQTITLYKFLRPDGGTSVSPVRPECDFDIMVRLVADDGMILTNDSEYTYCIDLEDVTGWSEVEDRNSQSDAEELMS